MLHAVVIQTAAARRRGRTLEATDPLLRLVYKCHCMRLGWCPIRARCRALLLKLSVTRYHMLMYKECLDLAVGAPSCMLVLHRPLRNAAAPAALRPAVICTRLARRLQPQRTISVRENLRYSAMPRRGPLRGVLLGYVSAVTLAPGSTTVWELGPGYVWLESKGGAARGASRCGGGREPRPAPTAASTARRQPRSKGESRTTDGGGYQG